MSHLVVRFDQHQARLGSVTQRALETVADAAKQTQDAIGGQAQRGRPQHVGHRCFANHAVGKRLLVPRARVRQRLLVGSHRILQRRQLELDVRAQPGLFDQRAHHLLKHRKQSLANDINFIGATLDCRPERGSREIGLALLQLLQEQSEPFRHRVKRRGYA